MTLMQRTKALLRDDPRTIKELSRQANVPEWWIKRLKGERLKGEVVDRVERLHNILEASL